jgi:uncharacterized protein (UPF0264 family)
LISKLKLQRVYFYAKYYKTGVIVPSIKEENRSFDEWQNETIEDFLERAHEWGVSSKDGLQYYE